MNILNWLFGNKKKNSIGITPSKETKKLLDIRDNETIKLFIDFLISSGRYKDDIILALVSKHKTIPFDVITDGNPLSLEKKKELKLNGRKKYGEKYIESLTRLGLTNDASTDFFKNCYYQAFGISSRKFEVTKLRQSGITKCRISTCNDERDCKAIQKYGKQVFDIDNVPELPLKECDAAYCRCMIVPVLD